jgi:two-component system, chemotaxis family, chemotaxis protein CheY
MAKTVLIVDDSSSVRQVVSITLKQAGYDVVAAVDGADALTKLDGRKYHLVISDVNMPRLDGISLLKQLKAMPAYRFTPVLMLTTEAGESKRQEGKAAGAKAWAVKPFQPEQLLDVVSKLVLP